MENKFGIPEHIITPVASLEGKTLKTGWLVKEKLTSKPGSTGGHYSVCYIVEKNGIVGFMKALNLFQFLKEDDDTTEALADMLNAYNFEKELLSKCRSSGLSKISMLLDSDVEKFPGYVIPTVPYLIFEKAIDDVRNYLSFSRDVDVAWKLRSLHNICVGLKQLHSIEISHQDLKPSNVFVYPGLISKLGDLGRSLSSTVNAAHSKKLFSGDPRYMPPEIMFKFYLNNWHARVYAIDCYLLGSMIVYYFTGTSMTALLIENLSPSIEWNSYLGRYEEVLPYLIEAFDDAISKLGSFLGDSKLSAELKDLVRQLCFPDPAKRGHPIDINSNFNNYSLERFVTKFDVLARKAEIKISGYS